MCASGAQASGTDLFVPSRLVNADDVKLQGSSAVELDTWTLGRLPRLWLHWGWLPTRWLPTMLASRRLKLGLLLF